LLIECRRVPLVVRHRGAPCGHGRKSLGTLLRNTREQCTNFSLPVAPVSPQRADRRQLASLRPTCNGLGIDTEHRGDLSRRQQRLSLWCTCGHVCGLSSWTSTSILRSSSPSAPCGACRGCPIWPSETILPSPGVTSRPPRAKFSVPGCPVAPRIAVTQGDSSDTYSRNTQYSEIVPAQYQVRTAPQPSISPSSPQLTCSNSPKACQRARTLTYIASVTSRCPRAIPSMAAVISATDSSPRRASSLNRWTKPP